MNETITWTPANIMPEKSGFKLCWIKFHNSKQNKDDKRFITVFYNSKKGILEMPDFYANLGGRFIEWAELEFTRSEPPEEQPEREPETTNTKKPWEGLRPARKAAGQAHAPQPEPQLEDDVPF